MSTATHFTMPDRHISMVKELGFTLEDFDERTYTFYNDKSNMCFSFEYVRVESGGHVDFCYYQRGDRWVTPHHIDLKYYDDNSFMGILTKYIPEAEQKMRIARLNALMGE